MHPTARRALGGAQLPAVPHGGIEPAPLSSCTGNQDFTRSRAHWRGVPFAAAFGLVLCVCCSVSDLPSYPASSFLPFSHAPTSGRVVANLVTAGDPRRSFKR
jgi:hypothetical protein